MNVNGKFGTIYHNEKDGKQWITLSDSTKDLDGNWHNHSFNIAFKQGTEIPTHKSKIQYEGFFRYYKTYITLQCTNWSYMEGALERENKQEKFDPFKDAREDTDDPFDNSSAIEIGDDELPF